MISGMFSSLLPDMIVKNPDPVLNFSQLFWPGNL
jgi:hypothetical protein